MNSNIDSGVKVLLQSQKPSKINLKYLKVTSIQICEQWYENTKWTDDKIERENDNIENAHIERTYNIERTHRNIERAFDSI